MATIDYKDLELALDFVSGGIDTSAAAYVSRSTGEICWESSELDEELPRDVEDEKRYVQVPTKHELDLGRTLALRFAAERISDSYRAVEDIFRNRGAYSRYKSLLESKGRLEDWHEFEEAAVKVTLIDWAESEGFSIKC